MNLIIVKNKNGKIISQYLDDIATVEIVDVRKLIKEFNPDEFIQYIRNRIDKEKQSNKKQYEIIKKHLMEKNFEINDKYFNPEYIWEESYADGSGTVLKVKKEGITIDIWANGDSDIYVFDDEYFFEVLKENLSKFNFTKNDYEFLRKAFYFTLKLAYDKVIYTGDLVNPWEDIFKIFELEQNYKNAIKTLLSKYNFEKRYKKECIYPDTIEIPYVCNYYFADENNWIEIFAEVDKETDIDIDLFEGVVYEDGSFLDALESAVDYFENIKKYLEASECNY